MNCIKKIDQTREKRLNFQVEYFFVQRPKYNSVGRITDALENLCLTVRLKDFETDDGKKWNIYLSIASPLPKLETDKDPYKEVWQ